MILGPLLLTCTLAACLAWWLRRRYLLITVDGPSMSPAYRTGDQVLVRRKPIAALRCGHVVLLAEVGKAKAIAEGPVPPDQMVYTDPAARKPGWALKRVLALPGDPVPKHQVPALRHVTEDVVPHGKLVVIGDNLEDSYDSRHYGYISGELIAGIVLRRLNR